MDNQALYFIIFFTVPFSFFAFIRPKPATLAILILALFTGPIKMLLEIRESPLILDITLIAALLSLIVGNHILRKEKLVLSRLSVPVLVLLVVSFAQMFNSSISDFQEALEGFRISAYYMLAFFLARYVITSKEDILLLLKLLVIACFLISIYGIRQHYFPFEGELLWAMSEAQHTQLIWGKEMRVFSTLNGFGAFCVFIPLGVLTHFALYNLTEKRFWKNIILVSLLLFLIASLFSMARAAWVASIIGIFFLLISLNVRQKTRVFILLGAILLIGTISLYTLPKTEVIYERFDTFESLEKDRGFMQRFVIMKEALEWLYENPTGNGVGSTSSAIITHYATDSIAGHNQFLDVAIELGLVPALFYIFIVLYSLWYGWKLTFNSKDQVIRITAAWITAYNLGFQAISMQGQVFGFPQSLHFWFLLGLLVSLKQIANSTEKNKTSKAFPVISKDRVGIPV